MGTYFDCQGACEYRARAKSGRPWAAIPSPLPLELYLDSWVGRTAREWVENYDGDKPWCCWVSFGGPHEPWDAPEPYHSMYDRDTMPAPTTAPEWCEYSNQRAHKQPSSCLWFVGMILIDCLWLNRPVSDRVLVVTAKGQPKRPQGFLDARFQREKNAFEEGDVAVRFTRLVALILLIFSYCMACPC